MGRKKKATQEPLSLFDDSFFVESPIIESVAQEVPTPTTTSDIAKKEDNDSEVEPQRAQKEPAIAPTPALRLRGKKQNLRVTMPDGTVICASNATQTMMDVINTIGPERVASVGMELCHIPLVSQSITPKYAEWTKPLGGGWYLMTQSNNASKYMQLKSIFAQLGIDAKIEMDDRDVIHPQTHVKKEMTRKRTDGLRVSFKDGTVIQEDSPIRTFQAVVEHIGEDKVRKTNLKISGRDIISRTMTSNSQLQLPSGMWLTLPLSTKDKFRILRVLSSMTHVPFDVEIISKG